MITPSKTQLFHLVMFLLLSVSLPACQGLPAREMETVKIALPALEQNALIYVAESKGYFHQYGLDVIITDFDSGVTAMKSLLENQNDLAVASEFPAVRNILIKSPISILASIDKFENDFILARKDRGIEKISDLKGKKIGVMLQSINEFYLGRFLELNGLSQSDVQMVDIKPDQFIASITEGKVDALIAWHPYIYQIQNQMKDVVVWQAQNNQSVYGLLLCRQDWLKNQPETVTRFMKALLQAENFIINSPQEAQEIVKTQLKYDDDYIDTVWSDHHFALSLDYSLITAMDDEAHWLIKNNLTDQTEVPDFYQWISAESLRAIKKDAVEINQ